MAVHKVNLDEFEETEYAIIAIHSTMEDYRLAYFINLTLNTNLAKNPKDLFIQIKEGQTFFSRYSFYDAKKDRHWHLIQNKNEVIQIKNNTKTNLFLEQDVAISVQTYLIPELKKADYFLKIEACQNDFNVTQIVTKLNTIDVLNMSYSVDTGNLKSKNNLIF
ncbi:MAG: IPExxxVDY family protein [Flavobacterium sp.]